MKSLYTHKSDNITKTWILLSLFFGLIIGVGYCLSVVLNAPAILFAASGFSAFSSLGTYWFSDKIALRMSHAKPVTRQEHKNLYNTVDNLAIAAGLPTPKIYIIDEPGLNAFATGRNPEHGVVVFTQGILDQLTPKELQGVAAHEISHIANRDMLVGTIAVILASALAIAARMMHFGVGAAGSRDSRGGMLGVLVTIGLTIITPILGSLLRMAISRKREYLADASGAMLTGTPEHLASALEKIGGQSGLSTAHQATAHLFIGNPFEGNQRNLSKRAANLFQTHPPISDRIERLRNADRDAALE